MEPAVSGILFDLSSMINAHRSIQDASTVRCEKPALRVRFQVFTSKQDHFSLLSLGRLQEFVAIAEVSTMNLLFMPLHQIGDSDAKARRTLSNLKNQTAKNRACQTLGSLVHPISHRKRASSRFREQFANRRTNLKFSSILGKQGL